MSVIFTLPNGVTCIYEENKALPKVGIHIAIGSGSASDSLEQNGLTNLTQEACNGGTLTRTRKQLAQDIEALGAEYQTETDAQSVTFTANTLSKNYGSVFAVLADMIRNPRFDPDEIESAKAVIEQEIEKINDEPEEKIHDNFQRTAFSGQPIGLCEKGTKKSLQALTVEHVRARHRLLLSSPSDIVLSFAGDADIETIRQLALDYFGDIPAASASAKISAHFTPGDVRHKAKSKQLYLGFGFSAASLQAPDRYHFDMLEELLSGGMSTPLFQEIREKRSLVYTVGASYIPLDDAGVFYITAGTGADAGEFLRTTFDLLGSIAKNGFSDEEIMQARVRLSQRMEGRLESLRHKALRNARQFLMHGRIRSVNEYKEHLNRVTNDDVRRACASLLADGEYALVANGPLKTVPSPDEIRDMAVRQLRGFEVPPARPHETAPVAVSAFDDAAAKLPAASAFQKQSETTLPNGFSIITTERPGSLSVDLGVAVGADNETPQESGAAHMLEHMLFKGTDNLRPGDIDRLIEGTWGGSLNAYTSYDRTGYYMDNLPAAALEDAITAESEMVAHAALDEEEYEGKTGKNGVKIRGEKAVVLEEMKRADDNAWSNACKAMRSVAYPHQAHGRPVLGTAKTVGALSASHLKSFYRRSYVPNKMVLSVTGPVKHEDVVRIATAKFGALPAADVTPPPPLHFSGGVSVCRMKETEAAYIALGIEGVAETDPDFLAYYAMSEILGGGNSSLLCEEIVDRHQWGSEATAWLTCTSNGGTFAVTVDTQAEHIKPVVRAIYTGLRQLAAHVTEADLEKTKLNMERMLYDEIETNAEAGATYKNQKLVYGRILDPAAELAKINALTVADVQRIAAKLLKSEPALGMSVPEDTDPALLPSKAELQDLQAGGTPSTPGAKSPAPAP